jgi:hypothetical protein
MDDRARLRCRPFGISTTIVNADGPKDSRQPESLAWSEMMIDPCADSDWAVRSDTRRCP